MGAAPWDEGWLVDVEDPHHPDDAGRMTRLVLADGAVVTSTKTNRARSRGAQVRHLIDPATGRPADTGLASVTVVAGEAWWGEVFAKAVFLAGLREGVELLTKGGLTGFLVDDAGGVHEVNHLEAFSA
jgi:thiamine biosynthesis lipoprotein